VWSITVNAKGKKSSTPWGNIGDGWRKVLGGFRSNGLMMMGLSIRYRRFWGSCISKDTESSISSHHPFLNPENPLLSVPDESGSKKSNTRWNVQRSVEILEGPELHGHDPGRAKFVVLLPQDSKSAKEEVFLGLRNAKHMLKPILLIL